MSGFPAEVPPSALNCAKSPIVSHRTTSPLFAPAPPGLLNFTDAFIVSQVRTFVLLLSEKLRKAKDPPCIHVPSIILGPAELLA